MAAEYDYSQDSIVLAEEPDSDSEVTHEREIAAHNLENPADAKAGSGIVVKSDAALASAGIFAKVESAEGVKWMATKPWKGAIVAPSNPPKNDPTAPDANLAIDWIHGYRGFDARSNLVYNSAGHMVYPIAGVVVVYDAKEHKQRHFMGHNDDVTCLAQSPVNANIIATGQVATIVNRRATPPHICVWDSSDVGNAAKVIKLSNAGQRAIRSLSFSSDGRLLASVANDEKQTVTIWDWATKTRLASHEGDGNKVYQVKWNHKVPGEFVTVGEKSIYFWTWDGSTIKRTKAKMGGKYPWQSFGSVTFSEKGYACCGAFDGSIYVFIGGEAKKVVKVHGNKINSLDWFAGGIVCGSSDCKAVVLDKTLTPIRTLPFPSKVSSVYIAGENLLVGTMGAEIFEVSNFRTADESKLVPTTRGHCEGELWGVAVAPDAKHYVTCGEDNRVFKWQLGSHKCLGSAIIADKRGAMPKILRASTMSTLPPNQCARAVAISPNGTDFVIGCNDGLVHVYDFASMTKKASVDLNPHGKRMVTNQKGNWIQVAKYSPSGDLLAVGTHGSVICLLDPKRGYAVRGVLDKHNSFITHIDWSLDGQFMQSNDGAYELLFWSVDEKEPSASRQHTNVTALRDTQWASQTCILGWSVQGIFDPTQDGTDVNTVDTAPSKRFIVTGDDYGDLNLFRYPCAAEGNAKKSFIGHSSHVVTARFTPDERHVISTGGNDKALFVWRVC